MVLTTDSLQQAIQKTKLEDLQKTILQQRFLRVLTDFQTRCFRFSLFFHTLRILISVGSLIVPALLSIQYSNTSTDKTIHDPESFAYEIYWATWVISLLVTTSNGIVSVFKIDKKYYFLHTTMEQLKSEGWQYLELSGRYSGFYTPGSTPTHSNQFIYFCHAIEKIKMHQVEEEYFKLTEPSSQATTSQHTDAKPDKKENPLVHPTPQASLEEIAKNLPPELRKQLISMVLIDGSAQNENESNTQKKSTVPVPTELPTSPSPEKLILRIPPIPQMPKTVSV
jgi:hypothetical protein